MILSRTPFRISFFGGGTDYPPWYLKHGGQVISTSIDKYCYISLRYLPPFFQHRIRLVYSKIELCKSYLEIIHPAVRETLRFLDFDRGLEIHHDGDLPAWSGMGSSSSFTVGLLNALYALKGVMPTKARLSQESIYIEQDMIQETVGSQDQVAAAYGGLNHILFKETGAIEVRPLTLHANRIRELKNHLMLFYTGQTRIASDVAKSYVEDIESKEARLNRMHAMVDDGIQILCEDRPIAEFGELLHEAWQLKRGLSDKVSNDSVDGYYARAREAGAVGGKITGAGGGGFLLLFVRPENQPDVRAALSDLLYVPFAFDTNGSQIIFYDPNVDDYTLSDEDRCAGSIRPYVKK